MRLKTFLVLFSCSFELLAPQSGARAEDTDDKPETPKSAYIKVINGCEVDLPEPWRAGLDLSFKDNILASDIRPGERCSYRKITFTGKDSVDLKMTQSKERVSSIPATFEKGCFYTLIIMGSVNESGQQVRPIIRKDFPKDPATERKGYARVNIVNAISSFPVSVSSGSNSAAPTSGKGTDFFLSSGEQPLELKFKDHKGRDQTFRNSMIVEPDKSYSAVILNSTEGGHRPMIFKSCETEEIRETIEQEKAAEKERETAPAS